MFCLKARVLTRHKHPWMLLTVLFALLIPVVRQRARGRWEHSRFTGISQRFSSNSGLRLPT